MGRGQHPQEGRTSHAGLPRAAGQGPVPAAGVCCSIPQRCRLPHACCSPSAARRQGAGRPVGRGGGGSRRPPHRRSPSLVPRRSGKQEAGRHSDEATAPRRGCRSAPHQPLQRAARSCREVVGGRRRPRALREGDGRNPCGRRHEEGGEQGPRPHGPREGCCRARRRPHWPLAAAGAAPHCAAAAGCARLAPCRCGSPRGDRPLHRRVGAQAGSGRRGEGGRDAAALARRPPGPRQGSARPRRCG
mmetsp:Transcript_4242/g.14953  ORF Transcript_4242/g.14953 Transcript_4242/m.14953 type:complete len:245 (-) Transcript_4242:1891-2625(-)